MKFEKNRKKQEKNKLLFCFKTRIVKLSFVFYFIYFLFSIAVGKYFLV